jgi:alpha-glucosidase
VGTWGVEPFDSDTALDFLDGLGALTAAARLELVVGTLESVLASAQPESAETLPEEVICAAAVIAANLPSGEGFSWNEEAPRVTEWLPKPVPLQVRTLAIDALEAVLPVGGWWWRSWVDDAERAQAKDALDDVKRALREG